MYNNIVDFNFKSEISALEQRISDQRKPKDYHEVFGPLPDDLYAFLCMKTFEGHQGIAALLPDWTSDEIRQESTGSFSLVEHVLDATLFWGKVRHAYEDLTGKKVSGARALDYGAGQGRVTRFAAKDVKQGNLYMSEPNPIFQDELVRCRLPAELIKTDWESRENLPIDPVDLIFSYSIFTHTSDELARNIVERWAEITAPGAVVAFTIRPGAFLDAPGPEMDIFTDEERKTHLQKYEDEEIIYKPYPGDTHWGVTVMPEGYIKRIFSGKFELVRTVFQMQTWNQVIIVMRRV